MISADHIEDPAERSAAIHLARIAAARRAGRATAEEYVAAIMAREAFIYARDAKRKAA